MNIFSRIFKPWFKEQRDVGVSISQILLQKSIDDLHTTLMKTLEKLDSSEQTTREQQIKVLPERDNT